MDDLQHVIGAYFYEFWDEHESLPGFVVGT